jgi:hypothetical protein
MSIYSSQEQTSIANGSYVINTPMLWVNEYLKEKLAIYLEIGVPFFPPSPNTIDDLTQTFVNIKNQNYGYGGIRCIKGEQLLYYFFATSDGVTDKMIAATELVLRLMDREDETAEEINNWMKGKQISGFSPKFMFHKFRVYQLEEVADIIDFGTARTYGGNKIIVEYEYHQMTELTNA